ncbi:hypothetical protein PFISCL1PPCAC_11751, partial [Pristionchus fissidentatus]
EIDFEHVEKILEFVDFNSLDLRFFNRHQESVFEFALSSGRPIDVFHSYNTWIDAEMIVALPRMEELIVQQLEGFSDEEVIAIAKQDHRVLQLSSNFSDPTTLPRLIEIMQSSEYMTELCVDVPFSHFNDFLSTVNLRELENKLVDTKENETVICEEGNYKIDHYYLNFGMWFMRVKWDGEHTRTVTVYDGGLPEDWRPSHSVVLPIM